MTTDRSPDYEAFKHVPIVLSVRLSRDCPHGKVSNQCCGYAEWLRVIHEVNRLAAPERPFGAPLASYDWWTGDLWAEEYPLFRALLGDERTNYVQAKTDSAAARLRSAVLEVTGCEIDDHGMTVRYVPTGKRALSGADA